MNNQNQRDATKALPRCSLCGGWPSFRYEPGCSYSICIKREAACPQVSAVPDEDYQGLADRIKSKK